MPEPMAESMDFMRILPAEVNAMIVQHFDIDSFVRARQVCKSWRALLSEGIIMQKFLAPYYTANEPPLICQTGQKTPNHSHDPSVDLIKLEMLSRFRHGKPAKVVNCNLGLDIAFHSAVLSVIGHIAVVELEDADEPPERMVEPDTFAINLLTGMITWIGRLGSRMTANNSPLFSYQQMPNPHVPHLLRHFECIDLNTLEILTSVEKNLQHWVPLVCFREFVLFTHLQWVQPERRRPWDDYTEYSPLHRNTFMIWSSIAKRSCSYNLDLHPILGEDRGQKRQILHAFLDEASESLYLTIKVHIPDQGDWPEFELVTLKMHFNRDFQNWKPRFSGCKRALSLVQANPSVDMGEKHHSPEEHAYTLIKVERITSAYAWIIEHSTPYNDRGLFASTFGDEQVIYNAITGEISGCPGADRYASKKDDFHKVFWATHGDAALWNGMRYETYQKGKMKVTCSSDSTTSNARGRRNIPLPKQKLRPEREAHDAFRLIAGNDRFMVTLKNDGLNVLAFDPGWNLEAHDFKFGQYTFPPAGDYNPALVDDY